MLINCTCSSSACFLQILVPCESCGMNTCHPIPTEHICLFYEFDLDGISDVSFMSDFSVKAGCIMTIV